MARNAALLLLAVGAAASPAAERDGGKITLENFGRAAHEWQELNDPVMGGQSVATFGIAGGVGVFNGTCAIVPSLSAPGFCSAQTKQKLFGDSWPDASAALAGGLVLVARSTTPWFAGFKVAFGAKDVPSASRYTPQGTFEAPFNMTGVAGDDGFEEIYVPFSSFAGQQKRAKFPTSKAPISADFHSFRLIFGRAIISRNGLDAWMLFPERARAEHSH